LLCCGCPGEDDAALGMQVNCASERPLTMPAQPARAKLLGTLRRFWAKINNDWVFNLSSMLAYSLLTATVPILLVLLAIAGFLLTAERKQALVSTIEKVLPQDVGKSVVEAILANLERSAGLLLFIGVISAIVTGSRLFIAIENCMSIIFRVPSRTPLRQNITAITMLLLYAILVPTIFVVLTAGSSAVATALGGGDASVTHALVTFVAVIAEWLLVTLLIGGIFLVMPNREMRLSEVWPGVLLTSALLVLYVGFFALYQNYLFNGANYGSIAAYIIVLLIFFYYLAFILLLGAEVCSWTAGQRESSANLPTLLSVVEHPDAVRRG
jgi:membrane protein